MRVPDWLFYAGERVNIAKSGCYPRKAGELEGLGLGLRLLEILYDLVLTEASPVNLSPSLCESKS